VQALVEDSPDLVGTLLPAAMLTNQASRMKTQPSQVHDQLQALLERQTAGTTIPSGGLKFDQIALFDQVSRLLLGLSQRYPLLLVLDDLQWADRGSISLLFHLGRRLAGSRILVAGAYRPEEVASGRGDERHPLEPVVNELQALYGENQVDLSLADGLGFVQAYLDNEPNHLDQAFRQMLHHHTGGQALFTVELLRGMQERGQLQQDETGCWVVASPIDWGLLPARVEAVIAERFQRTSPECQVLLAAACVQGETFTAEVLAHTLELGEAQVIEHLSGELNKQHRLVQVQEIDRSVDSPLARYRFRHYLYQAYLYNRLDEIERSRLHRTTRWPWKRYSVLWQADSPLRKPVRRAWPGIMKVLVCLRKLLITG
jgi:predicted ATPase